MNRDLFGGTGAGANRPARPARPERERPRVEVHTGLAAGPLPPVRQWFYRVSGRSYTRDEIYALAGFEDACREYPDDDIIVVLDCAHPRAIVYLCQIPRNHPARLDYLGRQDPAKQPFWKHGEIMYIQPAGRAPP